MNILIFTDTYLPKIDGIAVSVDRFSRVLAQRGHSFTICCPSYGVDPEIETHERIKIIRFKSASLPSYPDVRVVLPSHKKLTEAMQVKPDLIHIQTPGVLGQFGVFAAKTYHIPLIGTYHTLVSEQETYLSFYRLMKLDVMMNYFKRNKKIKKRLDRIERKKERTLKKKIILKLCNRLYESGSLIISPSYLIKKELESHGIKKPVVVISNGTDLEQFSFIKRNQDLNNARLLHVGRISYEKNCHIVLKAFALMKSEMPGLTLSIVGDGPALNSLKIEATKLGIADSVSFTGFISHENLGSVYASHDLFMTASTMETQGLVVLEAMATGMPCVGVNSFALPELIQHEVNGFIVEPYDHIAMKDKSLEILRNKQLYSEFSNASHSITREHDYHYCASKMESLYETVSGKSVKDR